MQRIIVYSCMAFALAAAPAAMAQGGTGGTLSVPEQIGAPTGDTGLQVDLGPATLAPKEKIQVDQPKGRDLCDPSVSAAARRAAGVDCERGIPADGVKSRAGLAEDPLLKPRDKTLKSDFESLDLGDDVPATVILQQ